MIEELSVVFAPSRLAEMDLRNIVQPLPGLPDVSVEFIQKWFSVVCRRLCTDRKPNGITSAKPTVLCNFMSLVTLRLSARVLFDESSIELSWEFFNDESSSPSSVSGRLPVNVEKSISGLN